ncbi:TetR/AcrR family transcriptional regulator [Carboxylicivirga taeanensis]|uniref:TetR/AcrR family transcriptional regulator n=1 Tax=Carboxylicivirga taeanensis TaxID=1416875 RepID=UPI003F6E36E0
MSIGIKINLNDKLYIRDPQETTLGQSIIKHSIYLIDEIGFEAFTFKKLAAQMGSTEASVYRYFENKHFLLLYLVSWYWEWVSYLVDINTMNISSPIERLNIIIRTIVYAYKENPAIDYVNETVLHRLIIAEGTKAYYTKEVDKENMEGFFSNYKMLCEKVSKVISEVNPDFPYPRALASNLFEMANSHSYFANHLPRLTEVKVDGDDYEDVREMLVYFTNTLLQKK